MKRRLYLVLSPRSLVYARSGLGSLFRNALEPLDLQLITDSQDDKSVLEEALNSIAPDPRHTWTVSSQADLADREADRFARYPNLRRLRLGHPCWRKITDPLLLTNSGEEMILLDPDLYFPNRYTFEQTPAEGLLLMWQRPNCLLPHEVVDTAMHAGIPLADHVDIGVAHWRGGVDLAWLDGLIGTLGGENLPRYMHIEAILWAAIAMRIGGGYLDPRYWHCWHRSQKKRLFRKLGVSGQSILKDESWSEIKCFHAGGEAKSWIPGAEAAGLFQKPLEQSRPGAIRPFVELKPASYAREQSLKRLLRSTGYYALFDAS